MGEDDETSYQAMCALTFSYSDYDVKISGQTAYSVRWAGQVSAFPPRPMDYYIKSDLRFRIMRVESNAQTLTPSQRKWAKFAPDYFDGTTNMTWTFERSALLIKPRDIIDGSRPDGVEDLGVDVNDQVREKIENMPEPAQETKREMGMPEKQDPSVSKVIAAVYGTAKHFATVGWINQNGVRERLKSDMATIRNEVYTAILTGIKRPERLDQIGTILDWSLAWSELSQRVKAEGIDESVLDAALEAARTKMFTVPIERTTTDREETTSLFGTREVPDTEVMKEQFEVPDTLVQQMFEMVTLGRETSLTQREIWRVREEDKNIQYEPLTTWSDENILEQAYTSTKGKKLKRGKGAKRDDALLVSASGRSKTMEVTNLLTRTRRMRTRWAIEAARSIVNEPVTSSTKDWGSVKIDLATQLPPVRVATYADVDHKDDDYYSRYVALRVAKKGYVREGQTYIRLWGEKVLAQVKDMRDGLTLYLLDLANITKLQPAVVQRLS